MGRRYVRDARGRFASKGYSGQTAGAGARLTATGSRAGGGSKKSLGNTRKTQTIGKPKGLKPRAIKAKPAAKPDTAMVNIPMRGARGRRLDAEITRNIKAQRAADRAASRALGRQLKSDTSRAKKLRSIHEKAVVAKYSAKMGKPATEVRSAIRSLAPSSQIKLFKQWVKENRKAAHRSGGLGSTR